MNVLPDVSSICNTWITYVVVIGLPYIPLSRDVHPLLVFHHFTTRQHFFSFICVMTPMRDYKLKLRNLPSSRTVPFRDIETTIFDPDSVFLNHIDTVGNPTSQHCLYKPSRNCHPSQEISWRQQSVFRRRTFTVLSLILFIVSDEYMTCVDVVRDESQRWRRWKSPQSTK